MIVAIDYCISEVYCYVSGSIAFTAIAVYFVTRPSFDIQWQEKAIFSAFFIGAVLCLTFSWLFHTVYCHSERVGRFFNKYANTAVYITLYHYLDCEVCVHSS